MTLRPELLVYRFANDLIETYGFRPVDVRIPSDEVWLNHPTRTDVALIRLSVAASFQVDTIEERTRKIKEALFKLLPGVQKFYDILIDEDEALETRSDDRVLWQINPHKVDHPFFEAFPNLIAALEPSENPDQELNEMRNRVRNYRSTQKLTFKERLKNAPKFSYAAAVVASVITVLIRILNLAGYDLFASAIFLGAYYKTFIDVNLEFWRFLTVGFVHIDLIHLIMNVLALLSLGSLLERSYGALQVGAVLLTGILFGSLFVYAVSGNILLVGMSGGIYALLALMIVFFFETGIIAQPAVRTQLFRLAMINLILNFLPQVSWLGHLGGFVGGLLMGLLLAKREVFQPLKIHVVMAGLILVGSLGYLSATNPNRGPLYGGTDQAVLEIAQGFGLNGYVERTLPRLIRYYEEQR
jgi:rhomboid protease GluP